MSTAVGVWPLGSIYRCHAINTTVLLVGWPGPPWVLSLPHLRRPSPRERGVSPGSVALQMLLAGAFCYRSLMEWGSYECKVERVFRDPSNQSWEHMSLHTCAHTHTQTRYTHSYSSHTLADTHYKVLMPEVAFPSLPFTPLWFRVPLAPRGWWRKKGNGGGGGWAMRQGNGRREKCKLWCPYCRSACAHCLAVCDLS